MTTSKSPTTAKGVRPALAPKGGRRAGFKSGLPWPPQHSPACSLTSTALHTRTAVARSWLANSYLSLNAWPGIPSPGTVLTLRAPGSPFAALTTQCRRPFGRVCLGRHPTPRIQAGPILSQLISPPRTPQPGHPENHRREGPRDQLPWLALSPRKSSDGISHPSQVAPVFQSQR